tara:strand:- start:8218 stop:8460 length:243 start_codon:yes stop_codon:yes gene_type:complete
MEVLKLLVRVMGILLCINIISGCSQGWKVGGIQLTPQDTVTNTVFIEIMDVDSNMHYYHGRLNTESNWCWKHNQFEDVVK